MNATHESTQYPYHTDLPTGSQSGELLDQQAELVRRNSAAKRLIEKYRRSLAADPPEAGHERWFPVYCSEIEKHLRSIDEGRQALVDIQERLFET